MLAFEELGKGKIVDRFFIRLWLVCALCLACAPVANAFILDDPSFTPWLSTATGSRSSNGRAVTLTWSLVPDGTPTAGLAGGQQPSDLISFLDTTFGGAPPGNPNALDQRPWFSRIKQPFDRWEELSGIDYVYEPSDDGASITGVSSLAGVLGTRGDIRIGGRNIDDPGGTLAFNYSPGNGDMVLDTSEATFYGNSTSNFRRFRNTVAHELGHGLGIKHVVSSTDALLLEPSIGVSFDGPQLDEVRAVHFFYGDFNEKSNGGFGNDTATHATDLGTILTGSMASVGTDANVPSQLISSTADDFVSISNINDTDFFSFTVLEPGLLDAVLTPLGGSFTQAPLTDPPSTPALFDADARSDLTLTIFDTDGVTPLTTVNNAGVGSADSLQDFSLSAPGEYFARVTGAADTIQLYQLDLSVSPEVFLEADFNEDSNVDQADLAIFLASYGLNSGGDANNDGNTNGADFLLWQRQITAGSPALVGTQTVPEPTSAMLLLLAIAACQRRPLR